MLKEISGGVCAAQGFKAAGIHCGVKANSDPAKNDLAMILSEKECASAAVYTLNRVKAAPIYITMNHLEDGVAWGVIANSGNANACCPMSHENAKVMCEAAAAATGHKAGDFAVASTGVIGQTINVGAIQAAMPALVAALHADGSDAAANAIMTTDTVKKEIAVAVTVGGKEVKIGAIAKGSGMIHPNMGTMLGFITTDCSITHGMLDEALRSVVANTGNMTPYIVAALFYLVVTLPLIRVVTILENRLARSDEGGNAPKKRNNKKNLLSAPAFLK